MKSIPPLFFLSVLLLTLAASAQSKASKAESEELIFVNGTVYLEEGSRAQAFRVVDGRFAEVGTNDEVRKAATVVWNGPLGKFEDEPYGKGTRAVAEAMAASKGVTIVGGGETAEAVEEYGLAAKMTHVSTGGGAFLEYVEGTPFPALAQIEDV